MSSRVGWFFRKTGCDVGAVVTRAYRSASCYSDGGERLRARELGDGLGALGHGVLGSSPGSMRRTDVWISRDESVAFLEKRHSLEASRAMRSKMSLMNEFMIDMPFLEMPVSGCTCLSTR